jgi:transposase
LKNPDGLVFFFDEGRFGLQSTLARVWAKRGVPLPAKVRQGYKNFYTYSAVSPQTGDSFSLFLPEVNTQMMNIFFEEFAKAYSGKDILMVLDQAGWHKAKDLDVPNNITLKYLPPYSPELNPIEKLWQWLRKEALHNELFESLNEIMTVLEREFRQLLPQRFKQLCHCSYA